MLKKTSLISQSKYKNTTLIVILEGAIIGGITGLIGAGGGFLIIPALVLLCELPMKKAIGTSLMIIAIKSFAGFIGDLGNFTIEWDFLIYFSGFTIIGTMIGFYLNRFINGEKLKHLFGWFTLVLGIYMIIKEMMLYI